MAEQQFDPQGFNRRTGGNFGPLRQSGVVGLQIDLSALSDRLSRLRGRFATDVGNIARQAHVEMAITAAHLAHDNLQDAMNARRGRGNTPGGLRPQRPEERLLKGLLDDDAYDANSKGWLLGGPYLENKGEIRYYIRGLEEGSAVHVDRELRGFFFTGGSWYRPGGAPANKTVPKEGFIGPRESFPVRLDERLFQTSKGGKIFIRNDIQAYRFFETTRKQFTQRKLAEKIYREVFSDELPLQFDKGPGAFARFRG